MVREGDVVFVDVVEDLWNTIASVSVGTANDKIMPEKGVA